MATLSRWVSYGTVDITEPLPSSILYVGFAGEAEGRSVSDRLTPFSHTGTSYGTGSETGVYLGDLSGETEIVREFKRLIAQVGLAAEVVRDGSVEITDTSDWSSLAEFLRQIEDSDWSTLVEFARQGAATEDSDWSTLVEFPRTGDVTEDSDWSTLVEFSRTAGPDLAVQISGDTTATVGADVTLTANPSGGRSPYTYVWSTGSNRQTAEVTRSSAGSVTATVTVTDADGDTASNSHTVVFGGGRTPVAVISASATVVDRGENVLISWYVLNHSFADSFALYRDSTRIETTNNGARTESHNTDVQYTYRLDVIKDGAVVSTASVTVQWGSNPLNNYFRALAEGQCLQVMAIVATVYDARDDDTSELTWTVSALEFRSDGSYQFNPAPRVYDRIWIGPIPAGKQLRTDAGHNTIQIATLQDAKDILDPLMTAYAITDHVRPHDQSIRSREYITAGTLQPISDCFIDATEDGDWSSLVEFPLTEVTTDSDWSPLEEFERRTEDSDWSSLEEFPHGDVTSNSDWSDLIEFPQTTTDSDWSSLEEFPLTEITQDSDWSDLVEFPRTLPNLPPICAGLPDIDVVLGSSVNVSLAPFLSDPNGDAVSILVSEQSAAFSITNINSSAASFTVNGLVRGPGIVSIIPVDEHGLRGSQCTFTVTVVDRIEHKCIDFVPTTIRLNSIYDFPVAFSVYEGTHPKNFTSAFERALRLEFRGLDPTVVTRASTMIDGLEQVTFTGIRVGIASGQYRIRNASIAPTFVTRWCSFTLIVVDPTMDGPWSDLITFPTQDGPWSPFIDNPTMDGPWSDLIETLTKDGPWSAFVSNLTEDGPWSNLIGPIVCSGDWSPLACIYLGTEDCLLYTSPSPRDS